MKTKIKKLSSEKIARLRSAIKKIGIECADEAFCRFLEMIEGDGQGPIDTTGYSSDLFYFMLASRHIKSSFVPAHKKCGAELSAQEKTVYAIEKKALAGYRCQRCGELAMRDDIEIRMIFWRLGTEIC